MIVNLAHLSDSDSEWDSESKLTPLHSLKVVSTASLNVVRSEWILFAKELSVSPSYSTDLQFSPQYGNNSDSMLYSTEITLVVQYGNNSDSMLSDWQYGFAIFPSYSIYCYDMKQYPESRTGSIIIPRGRDRACHRPDNVLKIAFFQKSNEYTEFIYRLHATIISNDIYNFARKILLDHHPINIKFYMGSKVVYRW